MIYVVTKWQSECGQYVLYIDFDNKTDSYAAWTKAICSYNNITLLPSTTNHSLNLNRLLGNLNICSVQFFFFSEILMMWAVQIKPCQDSFKPSSSVDTCKNTPLVVMVKHRSFKCSWKDWDWQNRTFPICLSRLFSVCNIDSTWLP